MGGRKEGRNEGRALVSSHDQSFPFDTWDLLLGETGGDVRTRYTRTGRLCGSERQIDFRVVQVVQVG